MVDVGFNDFGGGLSSEDTSPQGGAADGVSLDTNAPSAGPAFGSGLFGRRRDAYATRPQMDSANPVQDRVNALAAGRQRLQRSIDNPLRAYLKPRAWQQDVKSAADLDQQLFTTQQAIQNTQADREAAYNGGLRPETLNALPVNATAKTIFNAWNNDYAGGSWNAMKYLGTLGDAGKGALVENEGNFMPALADRNTQAEGIIDKLNNAATNGQPAYSAVLDQMKSQGVNPSKVLSDYVPNFAVPDKADAWSVRGKGAMAQVAQAKNAVAQYNTKQSGLGLASPVSEEKEAAAVQGSMFKGSHGAPIEGGTTVKLPNNEYGSALPRGSAITEDYMTPTGEGKWSNSSPDKVKQFNEFINGEQTKGLLGTYKMANDFQELVSDPKKFASAAGNALIADELGGIGRDLAEGSKAAGTLGLSKMLETKYGTVGSFLNKMTTNYSEFKAWMDSGKKGEPPKLVPRLTPETIEGIKDIAQFKHDQALRNVESRMGQSLQFAGRNGIALNQTGLGAELQDDPTLIAMANKGRDAYLADVRSHKAVMEGDTRIMLRQGTTNPDAAATPGLRDADKVPPRVVPTPGHEEPPPGNKVFAPQGGSTQSRATAELHYAKAANNGVATQAKPGDPDSPIQPGVTPNGMNLLRTLRGSESNGDNPNSYNLIVGGARLTNYDDHPGNANPKIGVDTKNGHSTASGAYQFTKTTWNEVADKYGAMLDRNKDGKVAFTPQNQDKAAWLLAQERYNKATGSNLEKDLSDPAKHDTIMKALSGTWTSLPGGSEPNRATASRKGFLGRLTGKLSSMYTPQGGGDVNSAQPEFNADVQKARLGGGELPVTGSVAGSTVGGALGGPVGGAIGGAAGGAAGQAAQNYATGKPLGEGVLREAGLGGAAGFVPGTRSVLGAMTAATGRAAAAGGVAAANEALTNPEATPSEVLGKGAETAAMSLGGESAFRVVGLALGRTGQLFNKFTDQTKQELVGAGSVIAKGKPEAPKAAGAVPVSETAKTAHEADLKAYEDAVQQAKDHGLDPEDLAHAVMQVPAGKIAVNKVVGAEKDALGARYQEIKKDVGETGVGTPKQAPLTDGPLSLVGKHADVPKEYEGRAVQAENNITQPAKNWEEKYQQIFQERSKLLTEYREALPQGDAPNANKAAALKAIADNVGDQQRAMLNYVYGPRGKVMADKLDKLHRDYAEFMGATKGGDIIENMAKPGTAGASATAAFHKYAKDDPSARQVADVLSSAIRNPKSDGGRNVKFIASAIMGALGLHAAPAIVLATEGPKMLNSWALNRAAGAPVTFKALLVQEARKGIVQSKRNAGAAFGRGAAEAVQ